MSLKTELQAAIAYCNTALTAKGADTASTVYDIGDKIDTIQTGGDAGLEGLLYVAAAVKPSNNANIPENYEITLPYVQTSISEFCTNLPSTTKKIKINANNTITNMYRAFFRKENLTEITLNFSTASVTSWDNAFTNSSGYNGQLQKITNPLDLTGLNESNIFSNCYSLTYLRFVQGTLSISLTLNTTDLDADSYASVFNGLATVATNPTLTLKNQHYGRYTDEQIAEATAKGWTISRIN